MGKHDAILWALGTGQAGFHSGEVERKVLGVFGLWRILRMEHSLLAAVRFHQSDLLGCAPSETEVAQGFFVDGENAAGGAVFRGHVGDGSAVGERQGAETRTVKLHELSDDTVFAQHFCNGQN